MNDNVSQEAVLRRDQFAIAAGTGGLSLYVPDVPDNDAPLPRNVLLLAAVARKVEDDEWVAEMPGSFLGGLIDEADARPRTGTFSIGSYSCA